MNKHSDDDAVERVFAVLDGPIMIRNSHDGRLFRSYRPLASPMADGGRPSLELSTAFVESGEFIGYRSMLRRVLIRNSGRDDEEMTYEDDLSDALVALIVDDHPAPNPNHDVLAQLHLVDLLWCIRNKAMAGDAAVLAAFAPPDTLSNNPQQ
jgi:hypothetical protein